MTTTSMPTNSQPASPVYVQPAPKPGLILLYWLIRIPLLIVSGSFLVGVLLLLAIMALQMGFEDRIYPGVYAAGIDLGGMTISEATEMLQDELDYDQNAVFTFRDADAFWQLSAADLGVALDVGATVGQAYAVGHSDEPFRRITGQASAWFAGRSVSPVISYDQNVALQRLNAIANEIERQPVNASLLLDGTQVSTTPAQTGRVVDVGATLARLDDAIMRLRTGAEIPLVIREAEPVLTEAGTQTAAQRIQTALSGPVRLVATDVNGAQLGPWTATVDQIAALLTLSLHTHENGSAAYQVDVDVSAFGTFLEALAPGLVVSPKDGRFHFNPGTGQLEVVQPSTSGRAIDINATLGRLQDAIFTADNRIVPIAFNFTLPRYHNQVTAAELGIRELVAESTTYFTGSEPNRRHNIAVGAAKLDGVIIPPGEEFSFNYYLGEIDASTGFREGKVIFGGRTIAGVGGGICQVSTTVFRAAFTGGFAITERNSHGYRVAYYEQRGAPPGLDAAIWQPERDFRFQNNTPHHLLIETAYRPNDDALQFRFYSTQHWRTEIDDAIIRDIVPAPSPKYEGNRDLTSGQVLQVDYAADGADVTLYRDVYNMQGELVTEDYAYTHYLPWQAIFQVPVGDPRIAQSQTFQNRTGE